MEKMIRGLIFAGITLALMGPLSASRAAENMAEGQVMLIAAPGGLVYAAGAEFGGSGNTSFAVRAGGFSYSYKGSGSYWEDGSGTIVGAVGRFYSTQSMEGMFFGLGVDFISGVSSWGDYWSARWHYGDTSFGGIAPNAVVGYKIRNGSMSFEPSLNVEMIGAKSVSVVAGIGLSIGVRF